MEFGRPWVASDVDGGAVFAKRSPSCGAELTFN
ncbi:uncharacterized protein G2W53_035420 [Senna tora]|uniref:Uncharacterized protein n=1 Tax=Senna tora TaxID=362788 RepID=A0A834SRN8_9FABA|nr:uncharacterized protein G2W53_035420 [Senna tora]